MTGTPLRRSIWRQNPALLQLFALCPLLGATDSLVKAMALGTAMLGMQLLSSGAMILLRPRLTEIIRLPALALIFAAMLSVLMLPMQAFAWQLQHSLGIFLPLLACGCLAAQSDQHHDLRSAFTRGLGFLTLAVVLGALRELLGNGSLFAHMDTLLGSIARNWELRPFGEHRPLPIALLPPGAFILFGMLLALGNAFNMRRDQPQTRHTARVRTTGTLR